MTFTKAQDVINYLYSLPKLHEKADLSYIKKVLTFLDNPQDKVKTVHVTGTNGKGSTSYYLSSLLQKAGQKTGLFVSPYVFEFNERIQLNGRNISNQNLVEIANQIELILAKIRRENPAFSLVTFEYEVVMAFLYFAREKCDYAVIEVGIGGEHDKTNVIIPEVSVITTVGLDHEKIIGPTLQDIAREKSGVIKKNRPVIIGNVPKEVLPIIQQKAQKEHATIKLLGKDFKISLQENLTYQDQNKKISFLTRPLVEGYDVGIAISAVSLLGVKLSAAEIKEAINQTKIPGRYQVLQNNPLIVLDGAHNIQAVQNLLNYAHCEQKRRQGQVRILIMMMKDKDIAQVFDLFHATDEVYLTTIDYPRAAKKKDFPQWIQEKYQYMSDWQAAYQNLKQKSQTNDILLVTGSFYLVGNILQMETKNAGSRY
ncbi:bifunctional folylpolyglutamate synthase/dihydrofolate synthase [Lactobacillus kimbladii]|uniref:bifunctional folylpolyglutamate synthase/dihydrofolate synthase n=1 Tax=Lactobacillus kimbladii TaxID=1218506 RepID=UPI003AF962CE